MKEIILTNGMKSKIDDKDFDVVNLYNWYAEKHGLNFRAHRTFRVDGKNKKIYLHRFILKLKKLEIIDHIDGDGLNNQRSNLRICTQKENCANKAKRRNTSSKYIGVCWVRSVNKWHAQIQDSKNKHIGFYDSEKEAALAYNVAASFAFREFARLNVV